MTQITNKDLQAALTQVKSKIPAKQKFPWKRYCSGMATLVAATLGCYVASLRRPPLGGQLPMRTIAEILGVVSFTACLIIPYGFNLIQGEHHERQERLAKLAAAIDSSTSEQVNDTLLKDAKPFLTWLDKNDRDVLLTKASSVQNYILNS